MKEKTINRVILGLQVGVLVSSMFLPEVFALGPPEGEEADGIYKIKTALVDALISKASYVGASCAVVGGVVLAFGSEIKKVIGNNMGYIGYIAFAPALVAAGIAALGATI